MLSRGEELAGGAVRCVSHRTTWLALPSDTLRGAYVQAADRRDGRLGGVLWHDAAGIAPDQDLMSCGTRGFRRFGAVLDHGESVL